ncbi:hypothetical protein ACJRO7_027545 [Eucalyptus globulus]|uniref:Uncharacterized protein n=1 Tax=Eucalyptus globulus TaxID=34317 RepID=A0ABD3K462_EUCGL
MVRLWSLNSSLHTLSRKQFDLPDNRIRNHRVGWLDGCASRGANDTPDSEDNPQHQENSHTEKIRLNGHAPRQHLMRMLGHINVYMVAQVSKRICNNEHSWDSVQFSVCPIREATESKLNKSRRFAGLACSSVKPGIISAPVKSEKDAVFYRLCYPS